ncbi:MAG: ABC transporter substrate-binding protein [Chloroflexi bacterium]|nr:ABC transporter substrate-binding protein [Chloroflexota bacterium]
MPTRRFFFAPCSLVAFAFLLSGCAPVSAPVASPALGIPPVPAAAAPAPSPASKPSVEQPRYGGILTRANPEDPPNLDMHQASSVSVQLALANVYNGLIRLDPVELEKVIPDLAERWDVSPDGKSYTFHLRKGVSWHDGKPFTAEDARFSLERVAFWKEHKIVSPRSGQLVSALQKVDVADASSIRITLKYPNASFLGNMAAGWVVMVPRHVVEAKGDLKKDAVGTGPFKWKQWNLGVSHELTKNSDYFLKGLPYLDGIRVYVIKDDSTRFAAFRTGQVKMTGIASKALNHGQAEMLRKEMSDKIAVISHPAAVRYMLLMQSKRKPWDDIRVRQALDLGFDRKAAITINYNVGMIGAAMHPKGVWGIPEEEMARRPGYRQPKEEDVARAKSLLTEAGYASGFKTQVLVRKGVESEQQGVVIKDQLARIGIEATLDVRDSADNQDRVNRRDFDLHSRIFTDPLDDPDTTFSAYYVTGGSMNYGEFSDKTIDELFAKQAAMLDQKARKEVVLDIQRRILDQVMYFVLFWDTYNLGFWKEVRGYMPGFGPYSHNNLDHVWLAK